MDISEKVAYLKGLVEGLGYTQETKEGKVIISIVDILDELALAVSDIEDGMELMSKQIDDMDEELDELCEDCYGKHDCDCDECDDDDDYFDGELYEVTCPSCKNTICIDEDMLDDGEISCPNCGENLEFDLDGIIENSDEDENELKF